MAKIETIGEIITWSCGYALGPTTFKTTLTKIREALEEAGLPVELARDLHHRNAFARALHGLRADGLVEKVEEDDEVIKFQVNDKVRRLPGGAEQDAMLDFPFKAILTLNKSTGYVGNPGGTPDGEKLRLLAARLLDDAREARSASDVTHLIKRIVGRRTRGCKSDDRPVLDLIPLRNIGGVYFVFGDQIERVERLDVFCKKVGANLQRTDVAAGPNTMKNLPLELKAHLDGLTEKLQESIDAIDENAKAGMLERRAQELADIRGLLHLRKDFLANTAEELEEKLASLDRQLAEINSKRTNEGLEDDDVIHEREPIPVTMKSEPKPELQPASNGRAHGSLIDLSDLED